MKICKEPDSINSDENRYIKELSYFFVLLSILIGPASAHSPGTFVIVVSSILFVIAIITSILKYFLANHIYGSDLRLFSGKIVKVSIIEFVLMWISLAAGLWIFKSEHDYAMVFTFITYSILAITPNLLILCNKKPERTRAENIIQAFIYGIIYPVLLIFLGAVSESIL